MDAGCLDGFIFTEGKEDPIKTSNVKPSRLIAELVELLRDAGKSMDTKRPELSGATC